MSFSQIGDHVELQRGNTYKSALLDTEGPFLLGLGSIQRDGGFKDSNLRTYGGPSAEKMLVYPGDLYVSLKDVTQSGDLLGSVARVPKHIPVGRMTQDTVKLLFKSDINRNYFYWLLRTPEYRSYCRSRATGTTNLGLSRDDFFAFEVPAFSDTRQRLVNVLEHIESKIVTSVRINHTLEAIAQAIFKSWFVDFEPTKAKIDAREALLAENPAATPEQIATAEQQAAIQAIAGAGDVIPTEQLQIIADLFPNQLVESELGEIPDGWCIKNLEQICSLASGKLEIKSLTANNYISTENMLENRGGVKQVSSLPTSKTVSEFKKGDILISNIRPYFKKIWLASFDGGRSNDVLCFRGINKISSCFLYCLLNRDEFFDFMMQTSKGAKMPRGDKQAIMRKAEVVPAYELQNYFSKLVRNFFNLIVENKKQNESLTMLRDTLLPKLLAGEIHID